MQFGLGNKEARPRHAGKRSVDTLSGHEEWLKLRGKVFSGTMKQQEAVWVIFTPDDSKRLGRKHLGRIARETMKTLLSEAHLQSEFVVELYKTDTPQEGSWCLSVSYEPPSVVRKRA